MDDIFDSPLSSSMLSEADIPSRPSDSPFNAPDFYPDGRKTPWRKAREIDSFAEEEGTILPAKTGFGKAFTQSVASGFNAVDRAFSKSLGNERRVEYLDYWRSQNPQWRKRPDAEGWFDGDNIGQLLGSVVSEGVPAIIATTAAVAAAPATAGATAGLGAMFLYSFLRSHGEAIERLESRGVDPMRAFGLGTFEAFATAAIEAGFGAELPLSRSLARGMSLASLKTKGSKELYKRLSTGAVLGDGIRTYGKRAIYEGLEEPQQRFVTELMDNVGAGREFSDPWTYFEDFRDGTFGGAILSSATSLMQVRNEMAMNNLKRVIGPEQIDKVHHVWENGVRRFAPEQQAATDSVYAALEQEYLAGGMKPDDASALVQVQKNMAYNLAAEKGGGIQPQDYINATKRIFVPETLTDQDKVRIREVLNDQEAGWAYLNERFGVEEKLRSVLEQQDAAQLEKQNPPLPELEQDRADALRTVEQALAQAVAEPEAAVVEEGQVPLVEPTADMIVGKKVAAGAGKALALPVDESKPRVVGTVKGLQLAGNVVRVLNREGVTLANGNRVVLNSHGKLVMYPRSAIVDVETKAVLAGLDRMAADIDTRAKEIAGRMAEIDKDLAATEKANKALGAEEVAGEAARLSKVKADIEKEQARVQKEAADVQAEKERRRLKAEETRAKNKAIKDEEAKQLEYDRNPTMDQLRAAGQGPQVSPQALARLEREGAQVALARAKRLAVEAKAEPLRAEEEAFHLGIDTPSEQARKIEQGVSPEQGRMRGGMGDALSLQEQGEAIQGMYFARRNVTVFYANADAGTILHEWMHVLSKLGLIPDAYNSKLRKFFSGDDSIIWTNDGHERLADAMISYIRDRQLPANADPALIKAFDHLREVFAVAYADMRDMFAVENTASAERIALAADAEATFDRAFGSVVPSALAQEVGSTIATAMYIGRRGFALGPNIEELGDQPMTLTKDTPESAAKQAAADGIMLQMVGRLKKIDHAQLRQLLDAADSSLGTNGERAIREFVGHGPLAREDEGSLGVGIMGASRLEAAVRGEDAQAMSEIDAAFAPVRQSLRERYGNTIRLYRVQGPVTEGKTRSVLSWSANPAFSEDYAGVRKEIRVWTDAEISAAEKTFADTGRVDIRDGLWLERTQRDIDGKMVESIDIMDEAVGGLVTDTESVRSFLEDRNEDARARATQNKSARDNIISADISIDDIVYATDRANQLEFIVKADADPILLQSRDVVRAFARGEGDWAVIRGAGVKWQGETRYKVPQWYALTINGKKVIQITAPPVAPMRHNQWTTWLIGADGNTIAKLPTTSTLIQAKDYIDRNRQRIADQLLEGQIPDDMEAADEPDIAERDEILLQKRKIPTSPEAQVALRSSLHGFFKGEADPHGAFTAYAKEQFGVDSTTELTPYQLAEAWNDLSAKQRGKEWAGRPALGTRRERILRAALDVLNKNSLDELSTIDRGVVEKMVDATYDAVNDPDKPMFVIPPDPQAKKMLLDEMRRQPRSAPLRARAGHGPRLLQEMGIWLRKMARMGTSYTTAIPYLTDFLDDYRQGGAFKEVIGKKLEQGWNAAANLTSEDERLIKRLTKENNATTSGLENKITLGKNKTYFTVGDAVRIYQLQREAGQREAMRSNEELTDDVIADAVRMVTKDAGLMGLVEVIDEYKFQKAQKLAEVYTKVTGKDMGNVGKGKYATVQRESTAYAERDPLEIVRTIGNPDFEARKTEVAMAKARSGEKGDRIRLGNPYLEMNDYGSTANNYIAKADGIKKLITLIEDRDIKDAMIESRGGDQIYWASLRRFLMEEMYPSARSKPMTPGERWMQSSRTMAELNMLGFRVTTPFMTVLSMFPGFSIIPGGLATFPRGMGNAASILRTMTANGGKSGVMAEHLLEGHPIYALLKKHAPFIFESMRYGGDPTQVDLKMYQGQGLSAKIKLGGTTLQQRSMAMVKDANLLGAATVWYTAYQTIYDAEKSRPSNTQSDAAIERKAAAFATDVVLKTQGASIAHEKNFLQRSHEGVKLWMSFTGDTQKLLQTIQHNYLRPIWMAIERGDAGQLRKWHLTGDGYDTGMVQKMMLGIVLPSLVWGMLQRRREPDEKEFITDLICFPLQSIPFVGQVGTQVLQYGMDPQFLPVGFAVPNSFWRIVKDVSNGEIDMTGKTGREIIRMAAMKVGFPEVAAQALRITAAKTMQEQGISVRDIPEIFGAKQKERKE